MKADHREDRERIAKRFVGKRIVAVDVEVEVNRYLVVTGVILGFDDGESVQLAAGTYAAPDKLVIDWGDDGDE